MNIKSIIELTGELPTRASLEDGSNIELMIRKKTGNKGYIAAYWLVKDGVHLSIIAHENGSTIDSAKRKLKKYILQ